MGRRKEQLLTSDDFMAQRAAEREALWADLSRYESPQVFSDSEAIQVYGLKLVSLLYAQPLPLVDLSLDGDI